MPGLKTVGASTNAKKIMPPIQTTSDSNIRNRMKDMSASWETLHCKCGARRKAMSIRICRIRTGASQARASIGSVAAISTILKRVGTNEAETDSFDRYGVVVRMLGDRPDWSGRMPEQEAGRMPDPGTVGHAADMGSDGTTGAQTALPEPTPRLRVRLRRLLAQHQLRARLHTRQMQRQLRQGQLTRNADRK